MGYSLFDGCYMRGERDVVHFVHFTDEWILDNVSIAFPYTCSRSKTDCRILIVVRQDN